MTLVDLAALLAILALTIALGGTAITLLAHALIQEIIKH